MEVIIEHLQLLLKLHLYLESLGFKKDLVAKVLKTCVSGNTSDLVKEALKKLQK